MYVLINLRGTEDYRYYGPFDESDCVNLLDTLDALNRENYGTLWVNNAMKYDIVDNNTFSEMLLDDENFMTDFTNIKT